MITEIEKRFRSTANAYHDLKFEAEKSAVRWRHSDGLLWDYTPGVALTTEEVRDADKAGYSFGYDKKNRVVCIRHFDNFLEYEAWSEGSSKPRRKIPRRELRLEYFIRHCEGKMEVFRFLTPKTYEPGETATQKLQSLDWVWMKGNKLREDQVFREEGVFWHNRYSWSGNTLKLTQSLDEKGRVTFEFVKNEHGQDQTYRIRKDGTRFLLGQPLPAGLTVKSLAETIRTRLLKAIPATVKKAKIKGPIYCVALAYDGEGNDALPPCLGIGLESERNDWIRTRGRDAKHMIWNPAEFQHYEKGHTQLDDDALDDACEWLNGELTNRASTAPAKRLLVEVAAELNALNWSKLAKVTPDFVVYAVDFELSDLSKNFGKTLSQKKLADFKAKRLL